MRLGRYWSAGLSPELWLAETAHGVAEVVCNVLGEIGRSGCFGFVGGSSLLPHVI